MEYLTSFTIDRKVDSASTSLVSGSLMSYIDQAALQMVKSHIHSPQSRSIQINQLTNLKQTREQETITLYYRILEDLYTESIVLLIEARKWFPASKRFKTICSLQMEFVDKSICKQTPPSSVYNEMWVSPFPLNANR